MPVLWKVSQVMFFFRRHNSADRSAAARAQILLGMRAMGNRQMDPRGAAVQDGRHKAARKLSRAGAARVHTRRLARASRLMGGSTWDLGNGGWDSGGNKNTATVRLNYDEDKP